MKCQFLRETNVEYCGASGFRKMIAQSAVAAGERCTSPDHTNCAMFLKSGAPATGQRRCPFLTECSVQYCEAAPRQRFVPYSEPGVTRCGTSHHCYCDLFLGFAKPAEVRPASTDEEVHTPANLRYTSNHMWLDAAEDGTWHVGIDGLLARVLGTVSSISFVNTEGCHHPMAVATANGIDVQLMFPCRMKITGANLHLRHDPARLTASPYSYGWLFEGVEAERARNVRISGAEAAGWMHSELDLLSRFVHEEMHPPGMPADGGTLEHGLMEHLDREQALRLFHEFFSPFARL